MEQKDGSSKTKQTGGAPSQSYPKKARKDPNQCNYKQKGEITTDTIEL